MKKNLFIGLTVVGVCAILFSRVNIWAVLIGLALAGVILLHPRKQGTKEIPQLTKEKESHYEAQGLTDDDIDFFRDTMAQTKERIIQLETNINASPKLKAIDLRHNTINASKSIFKQLVKEPQKLHIANHFLYTHLPNMVELTNKYLEINQHAIKDKQTYEALGETTQIVEQVAELMVKDYQLLVEDDLVELNDELTIAKKSLNKDNETIPEAHEMKSR
ncbi:5-bromo-4-chloroindolyl phosphate hydrolysis family protein [Enterococcus nangangensis]